MKVAKELSPAQCAELFHTLKMRFEKHKERHDGYKWIDVEKKLKANPEKLWSLYEMERTGGEPDLVFYHPLAEEYTFFDCSPESPAGRRSVCYDQQALESRKEHKPKNSAMAMAAEMGIALMTETDYRNLQRLGKFDTKTSSWIITPTDIRERGGALFADFRYGHVFVYHNGAESYYAARGFRGVLIV